MYISGLGQNFFKKSVCFWGNGAMEFQEKSHLRFPDLYFKRTVVNFRLYTSQPITMSGAFNQNVGSYVGATE